MAEQIDRRERRQYADQGGESHELQIVGGGDAIIDLQHATIPKGGDTALRANLEAKMKEAVKLCVRQMVNPRARDVSVLANKECLFSCNGDLSQR